MKQHSQKFLKQRKLFLVLPVLVLPFATIIFWILGGGQNASAETVSVHRGLNMQLPDAQFKEAKNSNKLSFYEQAEKDSQKIREAAINDPYFQSFLSEKQNGATIENPLNPNSYEDSFSLLSVRSSSLKGNEQKINQRLEQLSNLVKTKDDNVAQSPSEQENNNPEFSADVDRLESMMNMMDAGESGDPEMQQMEGMLDKILDIQHPDRVKERLKQQSLKNKEQAFAVSAGKDKADLELLKGSSQKNETPGFYQFTNLQNEEVVGNAIEAEIQETQTIRSGATVKLRLLTDIFIDGTLIPKGQFLYGSCVLQGDRLHININSILYHHSLLPVSLSAYDMDGMQGLFTPQAIGRDVASNSAQQTVQDVDLYTMDHSLATTAASIGLQAAKNLTHKKAKQIKITVKAGYKVLLKDTKAHY